MADDKNPGREILAVQKANETYAAKRLQLEAAFNKFRGKNADETLRGIKDQNSAITKLWKDAEISHQHYSKLLEKNNKIQIAYKKAALAGELGTWKRATAETSDLVHATAKGMGLDLAAIGPLALAGLAIYIAGLFDAQRVMVNWSANTTKYFGNAGKDGGEAWKMAFYMPGEEMKANARFVTDDMRMSFSKTAQYLGLAINVDGQPYQNTMEKLIVSGKAFGLSAEDMAEKLFNLQDVFGGTTEAAGNDLNRIAQISLNMGIAPKRFIGMVSELTNQFKLQNLSLHSVETGFYKYWESAKLGVQATEQLTKSTFAALGALSTSKIAALLVLSNRGGPIGNLGESMINFYKGNDAQFGGDRFKLLQAGFNGLKKMAPDAIKNSFAGTRLVMSMSGITDMETGVRLYDLLNNQMALEAGGVDVEKESRKILEGQTGVEEQFMNWMKNAVTIVIRYLMTMAMYAAPSAEREGLQLPQDLLENIQKAKSKYTEERENLKISHQDSVSDQTVKYNKLQKLQNDINRQQEMMDYYLNNRDKVIAEITSADTPSGIHIPATKRAGRWSVPNLWNEVPLQDREKLVLELHVTGDKDLIEIKADAKRAKSVHAGTRRRARSS